MAATRSHVPAHEQIRQAYKTMAEEARYRPAAPSDGMGNLTVPVESLDLEAEATKYAERWEAEEHVHSFWIGVCDYPTRPATIYAIEAARLMCGGSGTEEAVIALLNLAIANVQAARSAA